MKIKLSELKQIIKSVIKEEKEMSRIKMFDDLQFEKIKNSFLTGKKAKLQFDNGYGISVVSHSESLGGDEGLYEVAVLDSNGRITYDTPITKNVLGYLDDSDVTEIMEKIQDLPPINR